MVTDLCAHSVGLTTCDDVRLQFARTREHYDGAFALLHDSYCRAGLHDPNGYGMRVTKHQLLDTSHVLVATQDEEVLCTLTLVVDGVLGLPMEAVYAREIDERRARGMRLAEVTCLADRRLSPRRFFSLLTELCRLTAQYAERRGVDEMWIACHPRHAALYQRRLAFERCGELTDHPAVRGNPAVPLRMNFEAETARHPELWRQFLGESLEDSVLTPGRLPADAFAEYEEIARACSAYADEPSYQQACVA